MYTTVQGPVGLLYLLQSTFGTSIEASKDRTRTRPIVGVASQKGSNPPPPVPEREIHRILFKKIGVTEGSPLSDVVRLCNNSFFNVKCSVCLRTIKGSFKKIRKRSKKIFLKTFYNLYTYSM